MNEEDTSALFGCCVVTVPAAITKPMIAALNQGLLYIGKVSHVNLSEVIGQLRDV